MAQGISVSDMDKLLHSHLEPLTRRDKDSAIYQQAHGALEAAASDHWGGDGKDDCIYHDSSARPSG
jgi:hypothetical protein